MNEKTGSCVSYLENGWLKEGQRERLLQAYTNYYLHFGITTTSRVEGAHAYIKRYLGGKKNRGSLLTYWLNIERAVINQLTVVTVRTNQSRDYTPLGLDRRLFQSCIGVITWHALRLVQTNFESISKQLGPCSGSYNRSMGLPCAHTCEIKRRLLGLTPSDLNPHWFWDRNSVTQPLLDPL